MSQSSVARNELFPLSPATVARALGGKATGNHIRAPGPGHSENDDSLAVTIDPSAPNGLLVHSFSGDDPMECKQYVFDRCGLSQLNSQGSRNVEYIYCDQDNRPYMKVTRRYVKGSKTFFQSHWDTDAWVNGTKGLPRIPYRLPDLLGAPTRPIYIVEGEKDADRLAALDGG